MVKSKRNLLLVVLSVVFAFAVISFASAKSVKAAEATTTAISMSAETEVRAVIGGNVNGLRFTAYLSEDVEIDKDTYAGIIVGRGVYEAADLTIDSDVVDVKAQVFHADREGTPEGYIAFNAVIYKIAENNAFTQDLTARAYICDAGEYIYSDTVCVRSLAQAASNVLATQELTVEEKAIVASFVDGANATVSIGGTVLNADAANNINLMATKSGEVTVEPANIACKVTGLASNKYLTVDGNTFTATGRDTTNKVGTQVFEVEVGSKVYTVNVAIDRYVDANLAKNVLYDFDEAGTEYSIDNSFDYPAYLNHKEDGTLEVDAVNSYAGARIPINNIKLSDVSGFYITAKWESKYQWNEAGSISNMYVGISYTKSNGEAGTLEKVIAYTQFSKFIYSSAGWFDFPILTYDLVVTHKLPLDATIQKISIYGSKPSLYYIDEVGVYGDLDNPNVILNFDKAQEKVFPVKRFISSTIYPAGSVPSTVPTGYSGGVLAYPTQIHGNPEGMVLGALLETSKIATITFRVWVPGSGNYQMRGMLNLKSLSSATNTEATTYFYSDQVAKGQWVDAVVDLTAHPEYLTGVTSTYLHSFTFFVNGGATDTWYIDSISFTYKA